LSERALDSDYLEVVCESILAIFNALNLFGNKKDLLAYIGVCVLISCEWSLEPLYCSVSSIPSLPADEWSRYLMRLLSLFDVGIYEAMLRLFVES
jgi:hypothetical protein